MYAVDIDHIVLKIENSQANSIAHLNLERCLSPLLLIESTVDLISNSSFINNGDADLLHGGAIMITDSSITIFNSTFIENIAITGGAMSFECSSMTLCMLNLTQNLFEENIGVVKGGAVYYSYNRPIFNNLTFINNYASYGSNIASYPVKIILAGSDSDDISLTNVGSGILYDETLQLALVDYDNQVMVLNDKDSITINPFNFSESAVLGINTALLRSGIASFSGLIFENQPGAENVLFRASSKAIDSGLLLDVFDTSISMNIIFVTFRYCKPGEIQSSGICIECAAGTYSFIWNSTVCHNCMNNAV